MELLSDKEALRTMSENLEKLARPDAAERIVDEIEKVMKWRRFRRFPCAARRVFLPCGR